VLEPFATEKLKSLYLPAIAEVKAAATLASQESDASGRNHYINNFTNT